MAGIMACAAVEAAFAELGIKPSVMIEHEAAATVCCRCISHHPSRR